jgi:PST family polysaccharide transporter
MVTAVTGVLSVFKDFGLSTATVQRATLSQEQSSTLFWLNLLVGAVLGAVTCSLAPLLVTFFHEPRLLALTLVLACAFPINAAGIQHCALLQRRMRFVALAVVDVASLCASSVVGVALALTGFGYWALAVWSLTLPAVTTVGAWVATAWVPGRPQRRAGVASIVRFGGGVTLNGIVAYFAYNVDKILVGRFWGSGPLGLYGRAYQLIALPGDSLVSAVGGVAFAALSRVRHDQALLRSYFLKFYRIIVTVMVPLTAACALFAEDIVQVLFGSKWSEAAVVFRLLTPTLLVFSVINPTGWLLFSTGMVGRSIKLALVIASLTTAASAIGIGYGLNGVAIGISIAMVAWTLPHLVWATRGTGIDWREMLATTVTPLLGSFVAAAVAFAVLRMVGPELPPLLRLVSGGGILVTVYVIALVYVMGEKAFYVDLILTLSSRSVSGQETESQP